MSCPQAYNKEHPYTGAEPNNLLLYHLNHHNYQQYLQCNQIMQDHKWCPQHNMWYPLYLHHNQELALNWLHFKAEFTDKPEEDAEVHLLRTNDLMNMHAFPEGVNVKRFF